MLIFFTNVSPMEFRVRYLALFRRFGEIDGFEYSQEYPVNAGVPQASMLGPTFFLLNINGLPDDVICYIAIYVDNTTLYSNCDQASDLCS